MAVRGSKQAQDTTGWLIKEVADLTDVPSRTIRSFVERRLLMQPTFFGTMTRYSRDFVVRVLVIKALRAQRLRAEEFKRAYTSMSAADMEALAGRVASEAASRALGLATQPVVPAAAAEREPWQDASNAGAWWFHVKLLPGLELSVGKDASPLARRLARQFITDCVGAGNPDAT